MSKRTYRVYGKVQGVWFRESTRRIAVELGLSGHAINLPDGSVEVTAEGAELALDQLAAWLQQGPPKARVDKLSLHECAEEISSGFRTA